MTERSRNGLVVSTTESNAFHPLGGYPIEPFQPGQFLYRGGESAERFHLILDGAVLIERYERFTGQSPLTEVISGPALIGEESLEDSITYRGDAKALTLVHSQKIRPYNIARILEDPTASRALFTAILNRSSQLQRQMELMLLPVEHRVAIVLSQLTSLKERSFMEGLIQNDLAGIVGSSRESVAKALKNPERRRLWDPLKKVSTSRGR